MSHQPKDTLTETEAAELLGVSPGTLSVWRSSRRYDLPYVKVGRLVRYRRQDVEAWLESRRHGEIPTSGTLPEK